MPRDLTKSSQNVPLPTKSFFKKTKFSNNDLELQSKSIPTTSGAQQEQVVCVRNACLSYGTPTNPVTVLNGFNMTVPKGAIYALLGASGCGKTTLLRCILDQRSLDSGAVWILGGTPGSKASGVPGSRVGYMPQINAVYQDLTVYETFLYYGWVMGLTSFKIKERFGFLQNLLMLPDNGQLIKCLSGGQHRRVSLATALLHEPELLILDEPTVGLDPILRAIVWEYLVSLIRGCKTTIILTTHYIEEARQAHIVGLMRKGYLLAEEPPERLILRYRAKNLEDVFLKLCVRQNKRRRSSTTEDGINGVVVSMSNSSIAVQKLSDDSLQNPSTSHIDKEDTTYTAPGDENVIYLPEMPPQYNFDKNCSDYLPFIKAGHMKALIWKGFLWLLRNMPGLICILGLPITQIVVVCIAVGKDPKNFPVAVVNHETNNSLDCNQTLACESIHLSCIYLKYLEERDVNLVYLESEDLASDSVLHGINAASIVVKHNYSAALRVRIKKGETTKPWDTTASEIDVFRDLSNKHVTTQLKMYLYDAFQSFIQDFVESCGLNRKLLKIPINWEKPIYGTLHPNYTEFALPATAMLMAFFLAIASTVFAMLTERSQGSLEKTFVMGITEIELLIAHMIIQWVVMACQVIIMLVFAFAIFEMTLNGSVWLVTIHMLLTGFTGMCYGFLLSCFCDKESTALFLAFGSLFPLIFISGSIWPVEAIHPVFQPVVYFFPLTQPVESFRSMLQRGWGITSKTVFLGFISHIVWSAIFLILNIIILKLKKSEVTKNPLLVLKNKCQTLFMRYKVR